MKHALSVPQVIREGFEQGFKDSPDLRYASVEGRGVRGVGIAEYLIEAIADGKPTSDPIIEKHSLHFFFGDGVSRLDRFRALARSAVQVVGDLVNPETKGSLTTAAWAFVGEDLPEYQWVAWLLCLGNVLDIPACRARCGGITEEPVSEVRMEPAGHSGVIVTELFLPDGRGLPRIRAIEDWQMTNLSPAHWPDTRIPEWHQVREAIGAGALGEVTILDRSVWLLSVSAIEALSSEPPKKRVLNETEALIARCIDAHPEGIPENGIHKETRIEPGTIRQNLRRKGRLHAAGYRNLPQRGYVGPGSPLLK